MTGRAGSLVGLTLLAALMLGGCKSKEGVATDKAVNEKGPVAQAERPTGSSGSAAPAEPAGSVTTAAESPVKSSGDEVGGIEAECQKMGVAACEAKGAELFQPYAELDKNPGLPYVRAACGLGSQTACTRLGQLFVGHDRGAQGVAVLEASCGKGHADACVWAAEVWRGGMGGAPEDRNKAETAYKAACKLGNPHGCYYSGVALLTADGADRAQREKGLAMMEDACRAGFKKGCQQLAEKGIVVEPTGSTTPTPSKPVVKKAEGISWVISAELAGRMKLDKVRCEKPFHGKKMCHLTMEYPQGWSFRDGMVMATTYDGDGVQTLRVNVGPNKADVGGTVRDRLRVETSTKRVVIGL